ncbi:MAG: hypothetical protein EA369_00550 [Bradymonadales bacterium]|nr:MAG: hypothetical protein EA369_00550 [Bradymonadales bacterium]
MGRTNRDAIQALTYQATPYSGTGMLQDILMRQGSPTYGSLSLIEIFAGLRMTKKSRLSAWQGACNFMRVAV